MILTLQSNLDKQKYYVLEFQNTARCAESVNSSRSSHSPLGVDPEVLDKIFWLFQARQVSIKRGPFIGPRREMITPWSTNAVEILRNTGICGIVRAEEFWLFGSPSPESFSPESSSIESFSPESSSIESSSPESSSIESSSIAPTGIDPVGIDSIDIDPMLQEIYPEIDERMFAPRVSPLPSRQIEDIAAYNREAGLAFSDQEVDYLTAYSRKIGRLLTDAELFGFAQANSEHCRHKVFKGKYVLDGKLQKLSLFDWIRQTSLQYPNNIVSAYTDNVAFFKGPRIEQFAPDESGIFRVREIEATLSLKAETHNFPTTVCAFPGAATGTGGEIRDRMGGGIGSLPGVGTAGYLTSYARISGLPWENALPERDYLYQDPATILIQASNGASDYGNKFGQPLIAGTVTTFEHRADMKQSLPGNAGGQRGDYMEQSLPPYKAGGQSGDYTEQSLPPGKAGGQRGDHEVFWGFDKVIMLAGGVGQANIQHAHKKVPGRGDRVILLGGDNYRIGIGGGAVSSVNTGEMEKKLELNAVQRANAEMQQRVYRVIRALAEGERNPIISLHDHGAGGHFNCFSELLEQCGGVILMDRLPVGDPTLSDLEIIGNESQERMGLIVPAEAVEHILKIAERERCPCFVVGICTGDGRLVFRRLNIVISNQLSEENTVISNQLSVISKDSEKEVISDQLEEDLLSVIRYPLPVKDSTVNGQRSTDNGLLLKTDNFELTTSFDPVDLDLKFLFGHPPKTETRAESVEMHFPPVNIPDTPLEEHLRRVLRLVKVASKEWLTHKVDRSVTGLVAQQQTVGPCQLPLADVAVKALDYTGSHGLALGMGDNPVLSLVNPEAGSRLSVGEALLNIIWAPLARGLDSVVLSANWMWPYNQPGEKANLYRAVRALGEICLGLGIAVPTGKDSLSMSQQYPSSRQYPSGMVVRSPGTVIITAAGWCDDLDHIATPDLKRSEKTGLAYIPFQKLPDDPLTFLGTSSLAQVYNQLGGGADHVPDLRDPKLFKTCFNAIQLLLGEGVILAGHDVSAGGVLTALCEMAFAGNCGLEINFPDNLLFFEGLGVIIQYSLEEQEKILAHFPKDVEFYPIAQPDFDDLSIRTISGSLQVKMEELRRVWQTTSYEMERLQMNPDVAEERFAHFGTPLKEFTFPAGFNPVKSGHVDSGQVNSGQVNAGQVNSGQVSAGQVNSGQVSAGQVNAGQVNAGQVRSGQVNAGQVNSGQVNSGQVNSGQVNSGQVDSGQVKSDETHPDRAHSDSAHSDSAHSDRAHSDSAHSDSARSDSAHSGRAAASSPLVSAPKAAVAPEAAIIPKAAIIREKGTNGDREMAYALHMAGFEVMDVTTTDITSGRQTLSDIHFIVFCGGFSNSDVLGSARGWAGIFRYHPIARKVLQDFYQREDTLSLGICNGCQLMAQLNLIYPDYEEDKQPRLLPNRSGIFESRFLTVDVAPSPSILLKGLEGSCLGIWVAHGEGRFSFGKSKHGTPVAEDYIIPVTYSASYYPANPNGSQFNAAAIGSVNGRHLAMMPHPERALFPWQWGYYPAADKNQYMVTPWTMLFSNARDWIYARITPDRARCENHVRSREMRESRYRFPEIKLQ
jgi:phosphoribosylformylglycinamidine synthase